MRLTVICLAESLLAINTCLANLKASNKLFMRFVLRDRRLFKTRMVRSFAAKHFVKYRMFFLVDSGVMACDGLRSPGYRGFFFETGVCVVAYM